MTRMPVYMLTPSQDPPETRSLPAKIFLSSSNWWRGRVFLWVCYSLLKPRTSLTLGLEDGWRQKKVMHILFLIMMTSKEYWCFMKSTIFISDQNISVQKQLNLFNLHVSQLIEIILIWITEYQSVMIFYYDRWKELQSKRTVFEGEKYSSISSGADRKEGGKGDCGNCNHLSWLGKEDISQWSSLGSCLKLKGKSCCKCWWQ